MMIEKIFAIAAYADNAILIILGLMSVISVGIILERFYSLSSVSRKSNLVREKIKLALQSNAIEDFEIISRDTSSIEGRAAYQALRHFKDQGANGFTEFFNSYILSIRPDLERFLAILATIASNAPFIGLLGTVLGIMKAFNDLAHTTDAGQQTVMAGISVALIATACGLLVAIPAGMFYNYYFKKVRGILQGLEGLRELGLAYISKKPGGKEANHGHEARF